VQFADHDDDDDDDDDDDSTCGRSFLNLLSVLVAEPLVLNIRTRECQYGS
jgi:hypothetical protein